VEIAANKKLDTQGEFAYQQDTVQVAIQLPDFTLLDC